MAFKLPDFNLTFDLWRGLATWPPVLPWAVPTVPPDLTAIPCQLYLWSKPDTPLIRLDNPEPPYTVNQPLPIILRTPKGTDLRAPWRPVNVGAAFDLVCVPRVTSRYYAVVFVEDMHRGFPNEYRVGVLLQYNYAGPFPLN
jgi:hypothetical protein